MKKYVEITCEKISFDEMAARCSCTSSDDNPWLNPVPNKTFC